MAGNCPPPRISVLCLFCRFVAPPVLCCVAGSCNAKVLIDSASDWEVFWQDHGGFFFKDSESFLSLRLPPHRKGSSAICDKWRGALHCIPWSATKPLGMAGWMEGGGKTHTQPHTHLL